MYATVCVNGRNIIVEANARPGDIKRLAGIERGRMILVKHVGGRLQLVPDYKPLPAPIVVDVPAFVYG
jgi:hypothetical protein